MKTSTAEPTSAVILEEEPIKVELLMVLDSHAGDTSCLAKSNAVGCKIQKDDSH
jgi:hypothetical protein